MNVIGGLAQGEHSPAFLRGSSQAVHRQYGGIAQIVESKTRPRPLLGRGGRSSLHRVVVHVVELFETFLLEHETQGCARPAPAPSREHVQWLPIPGDLDLSNGSGSL